ncbi:MAG: SCO family protein [Jatrophihabitans sp.]
MNRTRRLVLALCAALALLVALAACGSSKPDPAKKSSAGLQGTKLSAPIPEPALTLTDQTGKPWDLRAQTKGRVTLLYFGYTHCPDVCPTTMADIAVALKNVPAQVRSHVTVVFVTSDPARDTAPVIKSWLAKFNPAFVGLTGNIDTIYAAAKKVGVPLEKPKKGPNGEIDVTHGAQVLAFGMDQQARVVYTAGTSSDEYAHDINLLAQSAS